MILVVWWLSIAATAWLMIRLATERLVRAYPVFSFLIAYQLSLSLLLLAFGPVAHPRAYTAIWIASQWSGGVVQSGVAAETFWKLTDRLRDRRFARRLLGLLALVAASVSLGVAIFGKHWTADYRGAVLLTEHLCVGLLLVSLLSLAFIRHARVPISQNLTAHVLALSVWLGAAFFGHFLMDASGGTAGFSSNFLIVGGQLAALVIWAVRLRRNREGVPAEASGPVSDQAEEEARVFAAELARVSSSVLRKNLDVKRS
ncbi:MAG: hypothetical protein LAO79_25585 [Acidobacteriia bacterium]|nr:hypothetical protein [Terriglobia bacterium]